MEDLEATNLGTEETHVSEDAGVADEAHAQGDDFDTHDTHETGDADTSDGDAEDGSEADDHEEIEHDGEKYKVPKKLKEAFLRQQDYTQKTQTLAEQRRAAEAERQAWEQQRTQQAETVKALRADIGKIERLTADLDQFKDVDWSAAQREIATLPADRQVAAWAQYNAAWHKFEALRSDLAKAQSDFQEKEKGLAAEQTQRVQAAQREAFAALAEEIPGFNETVLRSVIDHGAKTYGLKPEEAAQITDKRVWKLLHGDQAKTARIAALEAEVSKLKGQRTAQANNEAATKVVPATKVTGKAPATGAPRDDMPIDEWMRREAERVARKGRR